MPKHQRDTSDSSSDGEYDNTHLIQILQSSLVKKKKSYSAKKARRNKRKEQFGAANYQFPNPVSLLAPQSENKQSDTNTGCITLHEIRDSDYFSPEHEASEPEQQIKKLTVSDVETQTEQAGLSEIQTENSSVQVNLEIEPEPTKPTPTAESSVQVNVETEPEPEKQKTDSDDSFKSKIKTLQVSDTPEDIRKDSVNRYLTDVLKKICEKYFETFKATPDQDAKWQISLAIDRLKSALSRVVSSEIKDSVPAVPWRQRKKFDKKAQEEEDRLLRADVQALIDKYDPAPAPAVAAPASDEIVFVEEVQRQSTSSETTSTSRPTTSERLSAREEREYNAAVRASLEDIQQQSEPVAGPSGVQRQTPTVPNSTGRLVIDGVVIDADPIPQCAERRGQDCACGRPNCMLNLPPDPPGPSGVQRQTSTASSSSDQPGPSGVQRQHGGQSAEFFGGVNRGRMSTAPRPRTTTTIVRRQSGTPSNRGRGKQVASRSKKFTPRSRSPR